MHWRAAQMCACGNSVHKHALVALQEVVRAGPTQAPGIQTMTLATFLCVCVCVNCVQWPLILNQPKGTCVGVGV